MFWLGILVGVGATLLVTFLLSKGVKIRWFEYLLGAIGLLFVFATINHIFGSLNEHETQSALYGGLLFALLAIIFLVVTWQLIRINNKTTEA